VQNIENFDAKSEDDRDEAELVKNVKPLLEQAEKVLNETNGAVKGADHDNRLANRATRHVQDHTATPEEQRLAEALKVVRTSVCLTSSNFVIELRAVAYRSWRHN
jgi:hypothetical protein